MDTETAPACYRHPGRATRLRCSDCERPICVECTNDSAVGQKCPECSRHVGRGKVVTGRAAFTVQPRNYPVTIGLLVVNVAIALISFSRPELEARFFFDGAMPATTLAGEWWRPITSMFLHGGLTHLIFNMWALWVFGPIIEARFGSLPFATLYVSAGLAGSAAFALLSDTGLAVGASGAIFGLFGLLVMISYRRRNSPGGRVMFSQLGLLLAINMALPLFVRNVAWEAHAGGLVVGLIVATVWDRGAELPTGPRALIAAVPGVAAAILMVLFL